MAYFENKHAVITGAGSGIGRALSLRLNDQGCNLWLGDVNDTALAETVQMLGNKGAGCDSRHLDVADRSAVHQLADDIADRVGHVDLVVNNAGVGLGSRVDETRYEDLEWLMNINFWGVVHGCQAFLPVLGRAERSHLVNISSVFGLIGVPSQSAYNAAKFAVRGYSESLRQELQLCDSPIEVCCVHPGGVGTNIARRARNADPAATPDSQHAQFQALVRTTPEQAAEQILRAAEQGKVRLLIGPDARFIDWVVRLFPGSYPRFFRRFTGELELTKP